MEERQLILKLQEGSDEAFKGLYEIYASRLYGFIFSLTKSSYLSREIVQETFIKVWERRKDISADLSFKSYIFMIAKNHIINIFRNKIIIDDLVDHENLQNSLSLSENNTEKQVELNDLIDYIEKLKTHLSPRQREIFELSREKGLSNQEIADQLGISIQTVKNQLYLSLQILKEYFDKRTWALLPVLYFFFRHL